MPTDPPPPRLFPKIGPLTDLRRREIVARAHARRAASLRAALRRLGRQLLVKPDRPA